MPDETCKSAKPMPPDRPASCQVCGEPLASAPSVLCRKCKTPHHKECWRYNRGCSVYGCGCRTFESPSPALDGRPGPFTVDQPPSPWVFGIMLTLACFCLLGGILGGQFLTPYLLWPAIPGYILLLLSSIFYFNDGRYRLTFDTDTGRVSRRLVFRGTPLGRETPCYITADRIAEVHLHKYDDTRTGPQEAAYAALTDGSRLLLRRTGPRWGRPSEGLDGVAERVAAFADTTVRFIEGAAPPSQEEIEEAAAQKLLLLEEGAAPPADDE